MAEVTVVIPCYNHGHYLARSLGSVQAQAYGDWEAIVVDDGSTDNTSAVAQSTGDPRVRYHYQENRGLSGARNAGLKRANGRFITFLDADDSWEPSFLTRCVAEMARAQEAPGVYTGNWFIDEEGRRLPQGSSPNLAVGEFRRRLLQGGFFPVHAVMVRREALERCGGFDEALTSLEDWDLWLRLSQHGDMTYIPERLARYRVYAGSMSTDVARMQTNRLAVLAKHFGPPAGELTEWPEEKRLAYGFAHRAAALAYLEQGWPERCWEEMDRAAEYWPAILGRLDTYYELGCGEQSKGYRGRPAKEEIVANGEAMLAWLNHRFSDPEGSTGGSERRAFGQAYLALGMLAEQAGDWGLGREYLRKALRADAGLAREGAFVRRLVKLHAGRRRIETIRAVGPKQPG